MKSGTKEFGVIAESVFSVSSFLFCVGSSTATFYVLIARERTFGGGAMENIPDIGPRGY